MSFRQDPLWAAFQWTAIMAFSALLIFIVLSVLSGMSLAEDDPGWDCSTMGNQMCGATLVEDEIGTALTCWNRSGDIFCQEVITP